MGRPALRFKKSEMRNALSLANEFGYNVRMTAEGDVLFEATHSGRAKPSAERKTIEDFLDGTD